VQNFATFSCMPCTPPVPTPTCPTPHPHPTPPFPHTLHTLPMPSHTGTTFPASAQACCTRLWLVDPDLFSQPPCCSYLTGKDKGQNCMPAENTAKTMPLTAMLTLCILPALYCCYNMGFRHWLSPSTPIPSPTTFVNMGQLTRTSTSFLYYSACIPKPCLRSCHLDQATSDPPHHGMHFFILTGIFTGQTCCLGTCRHGPPVYFCLPPHPTLGTTPPHTPLPHSTACLQGHHFHLFTTSSQPYCTAPLWTDSTFTPTQNMRGGSLCQPAAGLYHCPLDRQTIKGMAGNAGTCGPR